MSKGCKGQIAMGPRKRNVRRPGVYLLGYKSLPTITN
jgi:hypothetical protein